MSARAIPETVRRRQTEASDPGVSAFVAANAGAGKTHVLALRVIRLLLAGTDPMKILCITFTKAAAANMAARVFDTLAHWIALDDEALDGEMRAIGETAIGPAQRARARRLFASALDTPGGLKVQTIHAFCTRLLHQFPFEANVAARFTVLDERAADELLDRATMGVLLDAAKSPGTPLAQALATAIASAADTTFRDVVRELMLRRDDVTAWVAKAGSVAKAIDELSRALGLNPKDDLTSVEAEIVEGPELPSSQWSAVAAQCDAGSKTDNDRADGLRAAFAASGSARVDAYLGVFLNKDLEPRKNVITIGLGKKRPGLAERLTREQGRVCALLARRHAVICRDRTAALVTIGAAVIGRYRAEKETRGMLDYGDLITKALGLLRTVNPSWVHYKLDRGIDHVLIDEAQDTSDAQWEIITRLVAEFTSGAGAREVARTVFAVGDEKQSIFSFQGAAPRKFDEMRRHFADAYAAIGADWRYVRFGHSFRSGPNIMGAVNAVFETQAIAASLTTDAVSVATHELLPDAAPGLVEIWPVLRPPAKRAIEGWDAPFDALAQTSPQVRLARRIAATIADGIAQREPLGREQRPMRAGDVLVLVRQRGALFEAIIRALKDRHVPVAGADRLVLTEHIAVVDLMALADALLLPHDDLALAVALKSPLFGIDEEQLFALAHGRDGTLRAALAAKTSAAPAFAAAQALLAQCAAQARAASPFGFYAWLLGAADGRAKFLRRLGLEAADALDEFLELALDYERREAPSLQGFMAWLRAAQTEIKRDMEISRDEVRVMTVHGAKGLEAPLVILADTTAPPGGPRPPRLLALPAQAPSPHGWVKRRFSSIARRIFILSYSSASSRTLSVGSRPSVSALSCLLMTEFRQAQLRHVADLLIDARRNAQYITDLPSELQITDIEEASFVQDIIAAAFNPVGGYKIGAPSLESTPAFAPMPAAWIYSAGPTLPGRLRILEAEIAFLVGEDLPPRAAPYTREEVLAAMASCHPAIEVLETGFTVHTAVTKLTGAADLQFNGAFVYGAAIPNWQSIDWHKERVQLLRQRQG